MARSMTVRPAVAAATLDAIAAERHRQASPVQVPVGIVEQAIANPGAGDRDALYRSLDFALEWVAGLHTALAETWPPGDTRAEEHFGASDEAEDERTYWAAIKAGESKPMTRPDRTSSATANRSEMPSC